MMKNKITDDFMNFYILNSYCHQVHLSLFT